MLLAVVIDGAREFKQRLFHIPGSGGTTLGTQAAVQAKVFILDHDATGLLQRFRNKQRLILVPPWSLECTQYIYPFTVGCHGQALSGTDIQAGIAFDTQRVKEHGLDITIQTALDLSLNLVDGKTQLNLGGEVLESL